MVSLIPNSEIQILNSGFGIWGFVKPCGDQLRILIGKYSHLSNKREVTLTDFENKFHPPRLLIS